MRLLCRAHNQYEAERTYGADFMSRKRRAAHERALERREQADVVGALRGLGLKAGEARRAVESMRPRPGASLEERLRQALGSLHVRRAVRVEATTADRI